MFAQSSPPNTKMPHQAKRKSDNFGHDDTSAAHIGSNPSHTDDSISQASYGGQNAPVAAQIGHILDPTDAGTSSHQTQTPQTETASHFPQRPFVCEWLLANGTKCTKDFKRKGDLTRHRNNSKLHRAQAQVNTDIKPASEPKSIAAADSSAGHPSSKPETNVQATSTPIKNNTTARPQSSEKRTRKTKKNPKTRATNQIETMADAEPTVNTESLIGATASAQDLLDFGNPSAMDPQTRLREVSGFGAQSSLAAESTQGLKRTASMMSGYDTQPSSNLFASVPPDNFNNLADPNELWHGHVGRTQLSHWPQNNQQLYSYGAHHTTEAQEQILAFEASAPDGSEFAHQHYSQYQVPMLQQQQDNFGSSRPGHCYRQPQPFTVPQHDPFGGAGFQPTNCTYPQYQAPIPSQQPDHFKTGISEGPSHDGCHEGCSQELPQQHTIGQDNINVTDHGFVPGQDHFKENCFGVKGRYCASCRARFLEWFPTSDFRQFVEEVCVSENLEYYPPMEA